MNALQTIPGIVLLVRRSLRQHALATTVTILATALAAGLTLAVFSIQAQTRAAFTGGPIGFDAVLGARGSALQLVLNSVFHLETSPGNIPWKLYTDIGKDPRVELAIPYAVGDNYQGFRIVGTTEELFTRFEYQRGRRFTLAPGGRIFDPARREAVIGSFAAQQTGLTAGRTFNPYHGLVFDAAARHEEEYVVVGVLAPTNSPSDRVIWIPVEGVLRMGGHVLRGAGETFTPAPDQEIPDAHKELSAVMLKFRSPDAGFLLDQMINRQGKVATLAYPIAAVMADLFNKMGWVSRILELVAYLVIVVSAGAILASIYNTINQRRREFAILRALGARRRVVFSAIVAESATIALAGALLGYLVFAAILAAAAWVIRSQTGVVLDLTYYHPVLLLMPPVMVAVGALAGVIPAAKAYATDVAANLAPST